MQKISLNDKCVLLTHADRFMGPVLDEVFTDYGAHVIRDTHDLIDADEPEQIIANADAVDIWVANLAAPSPTTMAAKVQDNEWRDAFKVLVDPLPRFMRALLPQMIRRQSGKILLIGSAAALRGIPRSSTYSAARGAQLSYIQAVGVEVARHNIHVNAIAQNFVDNTTYFPENIRSHKYFKERLKKEVPLGRLVKARENAEFAAYLCSDLANCFVGQIFPVSGGWIQR